MLGSEEVTQNKPAVAPVLSNKRNYNCGLGYICGQEPRDTTETTAMGPIENYGTEGMDHFCRDLENSKGGRRGVSLSNGAVGANN